MIIKRKPCLSDDETVQQIQELNPVIVGCGPRHVTSDDGREVFVLSKTYQPVAP